MKFKCNWHFCIHNFTKSYINNVDLSSLTWCSPAMNEPSFPGWSQLPRGYQGAHARMTGWRVGDMTILQCHRMTWGRILMQSSWTPWREAQWYDGRRSTPSWRGLLWLTPSHDRVSLCTRGQASWSPSWQRPLTDSLSTSSSETWLPSKHCRMESSNEISMMVDNFTVGGLNTAFIYESHQSVYRAYYTKHQRNLITSSEPHSYKSKALK